MLNKLALNSHGPRFFPIPLPSAHGSSPPPPPGGKERRGRGPSSVAAGLSGRTWAGYSALAAYISPPLRDFPFCSLCNTSRFIGVYVYCRKSAFVIRSCPASGILVFPNFISRCHAARTTPLAFQSLRTRGRQRVPKVCEGWEMAAYVLTRCRWLERERKAGFDGVGYFQGSNCFSKRCIKRIGKVRYSTSTQKD